MSILNRRPSTEPSLAERHAGAVARAEAGLSIFAQIKDDLREAIEEHQTVRTQSLDVANEHFDLAEQASAAIQARQAQVAKINELFG